MHVLPSPLNRPAPHACQLAVMAIFRNEAHVLREWLEHYLRFGVERFYLINNNSDDGHLDVLAPYLGTGTVHLFECERDGYQIGAYTELLAHIRGRAHWLGIFDLDEFIYSCDGKGLPTVLARFGDAEAVLIPWLSFGSSGHHEQPASVVHGFTRRGPAQISRSFLKPFVRPDAISEMLHHNPRTHLGRKVLADGSPVDDASFINLHEDQLDRFALLNNHYRLQSLSYFTLIKTARPEVHESVAQQRKKLSFFKQNDAVWNSISDTRLSDLSGLAVDVQKALA
ncbi:hypothetical protein JOD97_002595 [Duganella sp. 1411]|jgi:hypothetical protein|uniref:glycosyltransferase family 2 protein n=1 Tax=Duganella sp. 1411 TaxID=2806572 RepID=UPI001AE96263|nr:glycosyltransferase family 2 protein [Duganella sp. 1411]MBP1204553.1 hypothetical protein [Duganella sp. 1411]